MNITVCTSAAQLEEFIPAIDNLAANAIERNVFYESWMLLPALRSFDQRSIEIALVWNDEGHPDQLIGLFPIEQKRWYRKLPVSYLGMWRYLHCYLCTPLLRTGNEHHALSQILQWLAEHPRTGTGFLFELYSAGGPFEEALNKLVKDEQRVHDHTESFVRPFLQSSLDAESYFRTALKTKRLKGFRKKLEGLGTRGIVKTSILEREEDLDEWIQAFLKLESSGWKGARGTALSEDQSNSRFFDESLKGAFERGQLLMHKLSLDEQPIAMKTSFISGPASFAFKIAYDEAFGEYSPGVLLEFEKMRYILAHPEVKWMDSCTKPDNEILNRLWMERRPIKSSMVSTPSTLSRTTVFLGRQLKRVRDELTRPSVTPPAIGEDAEAAHPQ